MNIQLEVMSVYVCLQLLLIIYFYVKILNILLNEKVIFHFYQYNVISYLKKPVHIYILIAILKEENNLVYFYCPNIMILFASLYSD